MIPEPMSLADHLLPRQRVSSIPVIRLDDVRKLLEKRADRFPTGESRVPRGAAHLAVAPAPTAIGMPGGAAPCQINIFRLLFE